MFRRKMWCPLLCINFYGTRNFLKHWRDVHEIFRHCETKNFRRKSMIPLLCIKFFDTANFPNYWRDAHEIFRQRETKNFRRKSMIPLLCINFFDTPNFKKPWRDAHEFFRQCETKKVRLKVVICPLLSTNFFKNQKFSGKRKGSFTKLFVSVLWDTKQFDETVMHPSSYAWKFSRKNFFWNTKCSPTKHFGTVRQKLFRRKIVIQPPSYV